MKISLLVVLTIAGVAACSSLPTYVPPTGNYATFTLKGINGTPKPIVMYQQNPEQCSGAMKWNVKEVPCPCELNAPPLPIPANQEIMFSLWQGQSGGANKYETCSLFFSFTPKVEKNYTLLFDHSDGHCKLNLVEDENGQEKLITDELTIKNQSCEIE